MLKILLFRFPGDSFNKTYKNVFPKGLSSCKRHSQWSWSVDKILSAV